jgi:hypothetical protein
MDVTVSVREAHTSLDKNHFKHTREHWLRPSFDLTGLKLLREKAGRERDLRESFIAVVHRTNCSKMQMM